MITLRMLGIAVAILVGIPLAFAVADLPPILVPGGEIVDMSADAAATITDIALADPPQTYERAVVHNWPEQLVEGHTVYVQLIIPLIPVNETFTVDVIGNVECTHHVNASGPYFLGIPIPNRVHEAHVECQAGETVFVTPDPFYDSDETTGNYASTMQPTGNDIPYVAPSGIAGVAKEYSYTVVNVDWLGDPTEKTYYAYAVQTIDPFTHVDGSTKRWYCPIPVARIEEMGVSSFNAYVAEDEHALLPMIQ